ncbi:expressed unknown protein [Seminavis robusta]|uniref:Uncharacterized protein n=1 Tax=Seminavis robusta TaxID=568900 RepID=A0A9N8HDX9_9STRA|nr:expressed unknown protein [Seminavis robusta]|eukprot:Sro484_g152320.1 n/a (542) ;mRNA; f:59164-60789
MKESTTVHHCNQQKGNILGIFSLLFLFGNTPLAKAQSFLTPSPTPNNVVNVTTRDCSASSGSCVECVSANCAWAIGLCQDSCDGFPLDCYSLDSTTVPNNNFPTAQSVCDLQQLQAQDAAFCGVQTTCEACTSTTLKAPSAGSSSAVERQDSPTTCSWYDVKETCSHLAEDDSGKSSPYCRSTSEGLCYYGANNCNDCLDLGFCSWTGDGTCELNCLPGQECFSNTQASASSNSDICTTAEAFQADLELCREQADCASCAATSVSSGGSCDWFYNNATWTGSCGVSLSTDDDNDCDATTGVGCPVDSCADVPSTDQCEALATLSPEDITCNACLQSDCGWVEESSRCLPSCDFIQDDSHCVVRSPTDTSANICTQAENHVEDAGICNTQTDCASCIVQLKSDRRSNCQWYSGGSAIAYCGPGGSCDSQGACPSATCDFSSGSANSGFCGAASTDCLTCLGNAGCVWIDGTCRGSCTEVPTSNTCFSDTNPAYTGASDFFICNEAGTSSDRDVTTDDTDSAGRRMTASVMAVVLLVSVSLLW